MFDHVLVMDKVDVEDCDLELTVFNQSVNSTDDNRSCPESTDLSPATMAAVK
jgi:hypothetical protein